MKNEIVISPRELMYLAVKIGADEFFGLTDPFRGMTREEIRTSLEAAQLSLDKKGYVQMDFDGDVQVDDEVESLVSICAFCNGCISVDRFCDGENARLLVYVSDDRFASLSQADGLLHLSECNIQQTKEFLTDAVGEVSEVTVFSPVRMELEQLDNLSTLLAVGERNTQTGACPYCDEKLCTILSDGFSGKSDSSLLLATGFDGRSTDSMILLRTAAGSACAAQGDDGAWIISPAAHRTVADWIDDAIQNYQGEVG